VLSAAGLPITVAPPAHAQATTTAASTADPWRLRLVIAGLAAYFVRARSQPPSDSLRVLPFTTFPGFEIAPSFSPDGNSIVFSWFGYEKEYNFDLYVKQVGQERVLQLTHHPATFLASAWSPDGRLIAFMRQAEPDATGIYVISPLGGAERKLTSFPLMEGFEPIGVTWTPDSKWVAFSKVIDVTPPDSSSAQRRVHVINVETVEEHVLPAPASECEDIWHPAFSPDGRTLASVCVLTGGVGKIYLQDADGSHPREVAGALPSESIAGIAWMPDSQSIVYSADLHLWRVSLNHGTPERLLFAQDAESVSIAPTGNRLAYVQTRHPPAIYRLDLADATTAASAATRFISSSRGDAMPRFAPDGQAIAFASQRSGTPELWLCDRDGANSVQLSHFGGPSVSSPQWSPDGRGIVFDVRFPGKPLVYLVNRSGGPPKRFETGTPNARLPAWSADARYIYFSTERPSAVWKIPADGGARSG
jgi:Tol biopolymer transport system component